MRFTFAIGNPPYQESYSGASSGANSIYDKFLDESANVADHVEMIHPARFLFTAGSTPKEWNAKMLNDPHFKILKYEPDSNKVFPGLSTPIKGGVVVSYRDNERDFGAIEIFTPQEELRSVLRKVSHAKSFKSITPILVTSFAYHFTRKFHQDHPEAADLMSKGHANDLKSNCLETLSHIFTDEEPKDGEQYIQILGREKNQRAYKFIRREYINNVVNLDKWKLFISKANGMGTFGETLSDPILAGPGIGSTETFLSLGAFDSKESAMNAEKYIRSKFARAMLGVLKATQDVTPSKWKYVPLQDFSSSSDIDWTQSVHDIDQQLYKKYELTDEEQAFIESHVKEMD